MRRAGFRSKWGSPVRAQRALVAIVLLGLWAIPGWAAPLMTLTFEPYGIFFSGETHQPEAIDPQVFVKVPGMAGVGPEKIPYIMGVMPAHLTDVELSRTSLRGARLRNVLRSHALRSCGLHGFGADPRVTSVAVRCDDA